MTFHRKTVSAGVLRRYTLIEVLVVISILATLMAISSNVAVRSRKSVVGQFSKIMPSIPEKDDSFGEKDEDGSLKSGQSKSKRKRKTDIRRNLSKAGMLREKTSAQGKNAVPQAPVSIADRKIAVLRTPKAAPTTVDARKTTAAPAAAPQNTTAPTAVRKTDTAPAETAASADFPDPEGIVPGETVITITAADAPETERFTKFLHRKGSSGTMKEYRESCVLDLDALKAERKFKLEHGMDISLFSQYLRTKTVLETSPYRTYVLRKKILLASRQTFDRKKSEQKYKAMAEKKFIPVKKGDFVRITTVRGKTYFGVYYGLFRQQILLKHRNTNTSRWLPFGLVPEDQRWMYDETALKAKREAFVKQALASEEQQIKKQDEYIQKTLDAEFAVLKEDPLMANIR